MLPGVHLGVKSIMQGGAFLVVCVLFIWMTFKAGEAGQTTSQAFYDVMAEVRKEQREDNRAMQSAQMEMQRIHREVIASFSRELENERDHAKKQIQTVAEHDMKMRTITHDLIIQNNKLQTDVLKYVGETSKSMLAMSQEMRELAKELRIRAKAKEPLPCPDEDNPR